MFMITTQDMRVDCSFISFYFRHPIIWSQPAIIGHSRDGLRIVNELLFVMKADMKVKYKEQSRKQGKQIQVNLLTYYPSTLGPLGL
jgi:hypothetical protein